MQLYDSCGRPMHQGAMKRVGPELRYYHKSSATASSSSSAGTSKTPTPGPATMVVNKQEHPRPAVSTDPRFPNMTCHRKKKLQSGWFASKLDSFTGKSPGPYAHTMQRSFQMAQEQQLSDGLYEGIRESEERHRHESVERNRFREAMRSTEMLSVPRLRTPEAEAPSAAAVDWNEVFRTKKQQEQRNGGGGYAPSTVVSTTFASAADVNAMRAAKLEAERRKHRSEVQRSFNAHRNPVQCSGLLGLLPNERLDEIERNRGKFTRKTPDSMGEVERAAFEKEYNRQVKMQQQKGRAAAPDFDRTDVLSLATVDSGHPRASRSTAAGEIPVVSPTRSRDAAAAQVLGKPRPSEAILGTIPLSKAYPYQRQLHVRRQLDELNVKQQMIDAIHVLEQPRDNWKGKSPCAPPGGGGGVATFYEVSHLSPDRNPRR